LDLLVFLRRSSDRFRHAFLNSQSAMSFCLIFCFGISRGLPLHVVRGVRPTTL
jgi:hypothetical protein